MAGQRKAKLLIKTSFKLSRGWGESTVACRDEQQQHGAEGTRWQGLSLPPLLLLCKSKGGKTLPRRSEVLSEERRGPRLAILLEKAAFSQVMGTKGWLAAHHSCVFSAQRVDGGHFDTS